MRFYSDSLLHRYATRIYCYGVPKLIAIVSSVGVLWKLGVWGGSHSVDYGPVGIEIQGGNEHEYASIRRLSWYYVPMTAARHLD
jgi:hypothetical protein